MQPMTLQEVFTKAVVGFRAQGYVRSEGRGTCLYRGPAGTKCLIGHVIPDAKYDPKWDSPDSEQSGGVAACMGDPNFSSMFATDSAPLAELQLIHDTGYTIEQYNEESKANHYEALFRKYAAKHNLVYPEIQS